MKTLRPYQERGTINIALEWRKGLKRGLMVSSTGSGKAVVCMAMAKKAVDNGKLVLILADRCLLISQLASHADGFDVDCGLIMAGYMTRPECALQIASKDTFLSRCLRRKSIELPPADFIIIDEAHRSLTKSYQALLAAYPDAYICGMTATPTRPNGKGLGGEGGYQFMIELEKPSILLRDGFIIPARCFAPELPDLVGVPLNRDGDYKADELAKRMNRHTMVGDVPTWWKKLAEGRPTLTYGCDIAHSLALTAEYNAAGIKACHVDGAMDKRDVNQVLDDFKHGKWQVVVSAELMTEGIDLPFVGCLQMVRPTKSLRLYYQMSGRAMRPFDGSWDGDNLPWPAKKDFIIIDHAGCVLLHGLPGTDIEWSLDPDGERVEDRQKKRLEAGEVPSTLCCPECKCVHASAPACPNCGHTYKAKRAGKKAEMRAGTLVEVGRKKLAAGDVAYQQPLLNKAWKRAIGIAWHRGQTFGTAVAIFKRDTGMLPWQAGIVDYLPPDNNFKAHVNQAYPNFGRVKV